MPSAQAQIQIHVVARSDVEAPRCADTADRSRLDLSALRILCSTMLVDVPVQERKKMLARVGPMRRADDSWHLRVAMFEVLTKAHGTSVAFARLSALYEDCAKCA